MRHRGFDGDFWLGGLVFSLLALAAYFVATLIGANPILVILGVALAAWFILNIVERNTAKKVPEEEPLYCPWETKINETDFQLEDELTLIGLKDMGLNPDQAIGRELPFYTTHLETKLDTVFTGQILSDSDEGYIIRISDLAD